MVPNISSSLMFTSAHYQLRLKSEGRKEREGKRDVGGNSVIIILVWPVHANNSF